MVDCDIASRAGDRVASSLLAASTGYAEAMTAAYTETVIAGLDLWCAALSGFAGTAHTASSAVTKTAVPFGQSTEDWSGLPWLDPSRGETWNRAMVPLTPFDFFSAWASLVPLRGQATSWPVAMAMIDAGVPRSIAWPAAEANAAAVDATVAATAVAVEPFQKVFASAHGASGFAVQPFAKSGLAGLMLAWFTLPSANPALLFGGAFY
ncbi:MAG: hypothetical protein K2Y05_11590, partial [Hyphomicrobiaceae bacterium]|nr:hypothetical protein [Hyphomicrobiaceae bacterium]